jgi:hypothetical protein
MIMWSSKAVVCGRSTAGTVGSYPAAGMDVRAQFAVCRVVGSALCNKLITYPGVRPAMCARARKGEYTLVTLPRTVTPYRDSVDGTRGHVTYQNWFTR